MIYKNVNFFLGTVLTPEGGELDPRINMAMVRKIVINQIVQETGSCIWINYDYIFDPRSDELQAVLKTQDPTKILESYQGCREMADQISRVLKEFGAIIIHDSTKQIVIEGYHKDHNAYESTLRKEIDCIFAKTMVDCNNATSLLRRIRHGELGFVKPESKGMIPSCQIDIKADPIFNNIIYGEVDGDPQPDKIKSRLADKSKKLLAFGFPTTARGMVAGKDHVFIRSLLPSILKTISREEFEKFNIVIYIGIDHDDAVLDDHVYRSTFRKQAEWLIGEKPIALRMFRLPNTHRVAMLWSMLFVKAMQDGADYFYQVNDDLTLVTPNWLTNFTSILDSNNGFGVVGPWDEFNELKCQVLTMSMVSRVHYDIFGTYYPVEMRDWKTDRWLTWVYGKNYTTCTKDFIANNGSAPTRYAYCDFLAWRILLEKGQRQIAEWKIKHNFK